MNSNSKMKTREEFHKLIDNIRDEKILKGYYDLIQRLNKKQTGELWESLSGEEKAELLLSYDESFDPGNLITHEQVKKQHNKWLTK
jgi:hypothetical protein